MPENSLASLTQLTNADGANQEKNRQKSIREVFHNLKRGRAVELTPSRQFGIYLHIPFCFHKCHYCDFYSIVDTKDRQRVFAERLEQEIGAAREWFAQPVRSIFVGGGTPTLLAADLWRNLLKTLADSLPLAPDLEFTAEANPETVTAELAGVLAAGGVNRVSIGAQSFDPAHLKTLERQHEPANVARSMDRFRHAGIHDLNLDLIFGVPGQSLEAWRDDLESALALKPTHLSCYGLTYEPNTALTRRMTMGRVTPIDDSVEADMYEHTIARLGEAGYEHYEISAWARPGRRCRHNLLYWKNDDWWPFGPSASGHLNGLRWKNVPRLTEYLDHGPLPRVQEVEYVDPAARSGEALMMGLRLREGIPGDRLERILTEAPNVASSRRAAIDRLIERGSLEWRDGSLRLSDRGLLIADSVLVELI